VKRGDALISETSSGAMAEEPELKDISLEEQAALKKKRQFRKFMYRGVELEKLLDLTHEELLRLVRARIRRRFNRGLKRKPMGLIKKLRKAKKEAQPMEKPALVSLECLVEVRMA